MCVFCPFFLNMISIYILYEASSLIDTPSPSIKITGASINSSSTNLHHGHSSQVNINNYSSLYKHRNSHHKIHTNSSYANNLTNQHTSSNNRRRLSSTSTASAVLVGSMPTNTNNNSNSKSSASSSSTSNYNLSSATGSLPTTPTTPPNLNLINEEKLNMNLLNVNPSVSPILTTSSSPTVVKPTGDLFKRVDESAETEI
jgi:hypothetical protein